MKILPGIAIDEKSVEYAFRVTDLLSISLFCDVWTKIPINVCVCVFLLKIYRHDGIREQSRLWQTEPFNKRHLSLELFFGYFT